MLIVDKNKDYYDYLSKVYGVDKLVTFDRRGSINLTQEDLRNAVVKEPGWFNKTQYFVLEIGTIQFLFKITNIKKIQERDYTKNLFDIYDGDWELMKTFCENYHFGKKEITIAPCYVKELYIAKKHKMEAVITTFKETCLFDRHRGREIELPVLKNTIITRIIDPFVIWKELSNYISSKNNDKDIDIKMTDEERAVNHGFDKKYSFRNPVKL